MPTNDSQDLRATHDLRAIVRPSRALDHFTLNRWNPAPPLDRFVDRFWKTEWDLPEPFEQPVVAFPAVNLVFQASGSAEISGPQRQIDRRRLEGKGWAFGVMFRPGGFRPFYGAAMSGLADRSIGAVELFGAGAGELRDRILASDDTARLELIADFLIDLAPPEPTVGEAVSQLIEDAVEARPPITRVADLAKLYGVSARTLQRLFAEHVGVGPKFVLDRYRVQAAGELARRPVRSWADAAHQLGYSDQAHLTADLSSTFGAPPAAYSRDESS